VVVTEGIPQAEQLAPLASSSGPTVWRRSSGSLISLAHASGVMLNFTRYSGTVTPSHRLTDTEQRPILAPQRPHGTITCRAKHRTRHIEVAADSVIRSARPSEVNQRRQKRQPRAEQHAGQRRYARRWTCSRSTSITSTTSEQRHHGSRKGVVCARLHLPAGSDPRREEELHADHRG
jgi:hypothetical protein